MPLSSTKVDVSHTPASSRSRGKRPHGAKSATRGGADKMVQRVKLLEELLEETENQTAELTNDCNLLREKIKIAQNEKRDALQSLEGVKGKLRDVKAELGRCKERYGVELESAEQRSQDLARQLEGQAQVFASLESVKQKYEHLEIELRLTHQRAAESDKAHEEEKNLKEKECGVLRQKLGEMKRNIETQLEIANVQGREKIESALSELRTSHQQEVRRLEKQNKQLDEKANEADLRAGIINTKLETIQSELHEKVEELSSVQKDLEVKKKETTQMAEKLSEALKGEECQREELAKLESDIRQTKALLQEATADRNQIHNKFTELEKRSCAESKELKAVLEATDALHRQVESFEAAHVQLEQRNKDLVSEVSKLEEKNRNTLEELESAKSVNIELQKQLSALNEKLRQSKDEAASHISRISAQEQENHELEANCEEVQKKLLEKQELLEREQRTVVDLSASRDQLQSALAMEKEVNLNHQNVIHAYKEEQGVQQQRISLLKEQLDSQMLENSTLKNRVESVRQQVNEVTVEKEDSKEKLNFALSALRDATVRFRALSEGKAQTHEKPNTVEEHVELLQSLLNPLAEKISQLARSEAECQVLRAQKDEFQRKFLEEESVKEGVLKQKEVLQNAAEESTKKTGEILSQLREALKENDALQACKLDLEQKLREQESAAEVNFKTVRETIRELENSLKESEEKYQQDCATLCDEIDSAKAAVDFEKDLRAKVEAELREVEGSASARIADLESDLDQIRTQLSEQKVASQRQADSAERELTELRERRESLEAELAQMEASMSDLEATEKTRGEAFEEMEKRLATLKNIKIDLEGSIESLSSEQESSTKLIAKLETEINNLSVSRSAAEQEIERLEMKVEEEGTSKEELARRMEITKQKLCKEAEERVTSVEKNLSEMYKKELENLEHLRSAEHQNLKSEIERLKQVTEDKAKEFAVEVEKMDTEKREAAEKIKALSSQVETYENSIVALEKQVEDLQTKLTGQNECADKIIEDLNKSRSQLSESQNQNEILQEKLSRATRSIRALEEQFEDSSKYLKEKEAEYAKKLDQISKELETRDKEVEEIEQEKKKVKSTLTSTESERDFLKTNKLPKVEQSLAASTKEVTQLSKQLENQDLKHKSLLKSLNEQLESLASKLHDADGKRMSAEAVIKDRDCSVRDMKLKLKEAEKRIQDFEARFSMDGNLRSKNMKLESEIENLLARVEDAQSTITTKDEAIKRLMATVGQLEEACSKTELEVAAKEAAITKYSAVTRKFNETMRKNIRLERKLAIERKKSLAGLESKRQLSPSLRGRSPMMKKARGSQENYESRLPLAPIQPRRLLQ